MKDSNFVADDGSGDTYVLGQDTENPDLFIIQNYCSGHFCGELIMYREDIAGIIKLLQTYLNESNEALS